MGRTTCWMGAMWGDETHGEGLCGGKVVVGGGVNGLAEVLLLRRWGRLRVWAGSVRRYSTPVVGDRRVSTQWSAVGTSRLCTGGAEVRGA